MNDSRLPNTTVDQGVRLVQNEATLALLLRAAEQLMASLEPAVVFETLTRLGTGEIAEWCVLYGREESGEIVPLATAHVGADRAIEAIDGISRELAGMLRLARTEGAMIVHEPVELLRGILSLDGHGDHPPRGQVSGALMVVPLHGAGTSWRGWLLFGDGRPDRSFVEADLSIAAELARLGGVAVGSALRHHELRQELERKDSVLADVTEALGRIEMRVRRLFDANVIGMIFSDLNGHVLEANDAFLAMLGFDRDDLHSGAIRLDRLAAPEYQATYRKAIEELKTLGVCAPFETEYTRADNSRVPVLVGAAMLESSPDLTAAFMLDLTEKRRAERALIESEQRHRALLSAIPDMIFRFDADGTLLDYAGPVAGEAIGSPDSFLGKSVRDVMPVEVAESALYHIGETLRTGDVQRYEYELERDGELRHYEVRLVVSGLEEVIGIVRDVTDRKIAEEGLRASESRLRALIENSWDAIALIGVDGVIRYASPSTKRILGYEPEELAGQSLFDIMHPDDLPATGAMFGALLGTPGVSTTGRYRNRHKDGTWRWIEGTGTNLLHEPSVMAIVANFRDITESREAEQELKIAKESAEKANAAKDQFLAVLSHELRTPLTPVLAAVETLREVELPEEMAGIIDVVARNVELEARLIDDLLDLTRIAKGKLQLNRSIVDLHEIVGNVRQVCGAEAQAKGIAMSFELTAPRCAVDGDPARLQQVFWNLVQNAVKFTPAGGSITLRSSLEGAVLRVRVIDTGKGIESQHLGRIFDAFEQGEGTTTRRYGGLGLGLAISKMLVTMHGGALAAASDGPGRGATFTVELPLAAIESGRSGDDAPRVDEASDRPVRVLLVDDHRDTNTVMKLLLERSGYHVIVAESVGSALEAAGREDFDLLVSDIGLPDGSGLDIVRELRARKPGFKAIALSGFGMEEDVRRSIEAGFDEHLTKPVAYRKLIETMTTLVG